MSFDLSALRALINDLSFDRYSTLAKPKLLKIKINTKKLIIIRV
jgi:hypothetical protein